MYMMCHDIIKIQRTPGDYKSVVSVLSSDRVFGSTR